VRAVFETNVFGQVRMLHAVLPLLLRSAAPVVVNVSSGLALTRELANPNSFTHFYPDVAYPSSKAAIEPVGRLRAIATKTPQPVLSCR
jgi:NAD(P)-dependent dehydrogenase (short-subunit alcohol dehydrogenase family)